MPRLAKLIASIVNIYGTLLAISAVYMSRPSESFSGFRFSGLTIACAMGEKTKAPKPNAPRMMPLTNPFRSGNHSQPHASGGIIQRPNPIPYKIEKQNMYCLYV